MAVTAIGSFKFSVYFAARIAAAKGLVEKK